MSNYRRNREGSVYFFTVVTHRRRPILTTEIGRRCFREAIETVRRDRPFSILGMVLLPDHVHTLWELPQGDSDYSTRWRRMKSLFTTAWMAAGGMSAGVTASRSERRERGVWQRRFDEHTCRDEADVKRCLDYLHVNPLKHGLVSKVREWPWSSFHRHQRQGEYDLDWGNASTWYGDEFSQFE